MFELLRKTRFISPCFGLLLPIICMADLSPVHRNVCGMSQLHSTTGCSVISGHFQVSATAAVVGED